jgi:Family of unknown function (DUF6288)
MSLRPFLLVSFVLVFVAGNLEAQRFGRNQNDWYPLGGIEARGDVTSLKEKPAIEVKALAPEGLAAQGGLLVGDVILKAGGKKLKGDGDEIIDGFCALVEKAEAKRPAARDEFGKIVLEVQGRDGKTRKVTVPLRPLGGSPKSPVKNAKVAAVLKSALGYLQAEQSPEGNFAKQVANANQSTVTAALAGLAFLGAGDNYLPNYRRALRYVMRHVLDDEGGPGRSSGQNWNQTNWTLGYGAVFLAEALSFELTQKGEPSAAAPAKESDENSEAPEPLTPQAIRERLTEVVRKIEANQEATGGYAHGPGGPNALGYLELEIVSNYVIAGMGMARRLGVKPDEAKAVKAIEYVKSCTSGGGVAYSTRPGQMGAGDPGRSAGAYWAFRQMGRKGKVTSAMAKYFERKMDELPEGHVSPAMHILAGGLAAAQRGKGAQKKFWKRYLPYIMASRIRGGAFDARPTEESRSLRSNADRGNGLAFITAHYALVMQLGQGRYRLLDTEAD